MKKTYPNSFIRKLLVISAFSSLCLLAGSSKQNNDPTITSPPTSEEKEVVEIPKDPYEENRMVLKKEDYFSGEFVVYENGFIDPKTINPIIIEDEDALNKIDVLINKYYEIKKDWIPSDLEFINTNFSRKSQLRHVAALAWEEMDQAAKAVDITFYARDGWRSEWLQNTYFSNAYNSNPANASCFNAIPWRSEHQLGLALDVSDVTTTENSLRQDFEFTPHGQFLVNEAWKYGWIIRYTTNTQNITQYFNEPWHIRYVGKDLAKILIENDLTLEEYHMKNYQ